MAKKEVVVVINGQETVSDAAESAGASLSVFGKKIPLFVDPVQLATKAVELLAKGIRAIKDYALESFDAYDAYAGSQRKLEASSRLLGIPMAELNATVKAGREQFQLSTEIANDLAVATGNLEKKTGASVDKQKLMASVLELGAARGLTAKESLESFERAIMGIDAGFDKLYGKNQSVIFDEYAKSIGTTVGKLTDMQKGQALVWATMEAGEKVQGAYQAYLDDAAGAQAHLTQQMDETKVEFGRALQPVRVFALQGLSVVVGALGSLLVSLGRVVNAVGVVLVGAFKAGQTAIGGLVLGIGKLTGNKAMEEWGRAQSTAFADFTTTLGKMEKKYFSTADAATESASAQAKAADAVTQAVAASATAQEKATTRAKTAAQQRAEAAEKETARVQATIEKNLGPPLARLVGITEGSILSLADAAQRQLPPDSAEKFVTHMEALAENARLIGERITAVPPAVEKGQKTTKQMADDVAHIARAGLDAASAFGVMDDKSAAVLNSVINIGTSIARLAGGDVFGGLSGILGGVANVVSTIIGGDAERRRLTQQNNDALAKLSRDIGGLKLNITGEDFIKAQTALTSVINQLKGGRGAANENDVRNALYGQGLTMEDFERIAKEFGIEVRTKSGALNVDSVKAVLEALNLTDLGKLSSRFADQLAYFEQSQRVRGVSGLTQVQDLLDYLREQGGVSALSGVTGTDATTMRAQLQALFEQFNAGGIGAGALGKMTGGDLMSMVLRLIDLIDQAEKSGGSSSTTSTSATTTASGETGMVSGGGITITSDALTEMIRTTSEATIHVLEVSQVIHERIAVAVEGGLVHLQSIDAKMDDLIEINAGNVDRINQALADARDLARTNSGQGPSYG